VTGHDDTLIPTLPFRISFVELPADTTRPAIQSYSWMVDPMGRWYVLGGRLAGLHRFGTSGDNFPNPNTSLWLVDPSTPKVTELLDLTLLDPAIGDPLMATNQQSYYDRATDEWLIIGGYGTDSTTKTDRTFPTLIRIPVAQFTAVVTSSAPPADKAAKVNAMVRHQVDPFFAVTGGALRRIGGRYVITFGQGFNGQYAPFTGLVAQQYTNAVRYFSLDPRTGLAVNMGELLSADLDQPFHRRDGVFVDTVDPASGLARFAAFGGVFPPGKLDGYLYPVYVDEQLGQLTTIVDRSVQQLFSQYGCPTIVVHDPNRRAVFHTFFGGISRYYFHQTAAQKAVFDEVTAEGRNDGLPFISDITTLVVRADGTSSQYIAPDPVPGGALRGASTDFVPIAPGTNPAVADSGVIDLSKIVVGATVVVGYIYGGIDADFPLPKIPSYGTQATNAMYRVEVTNAVSPAQLPASQGHRSNGVLPPPVNR
jgi:hypothetical protein